MVEEAITVVEESIEEVSTNLDGKDLIINPDFTLIIIFHELLLIPKLFIETCLQDNTVTLLYNK